jgi:hypothetical protein
MTLVPFLHGTVAMGCAIVAVFFLRFWRQSADRLFVFFSAAFAILAFDYALLGLLSSATEWRVPVFMVRVSAFLIILLGIADKNRR